MSLPKSKPSRIAVTGATGFVGGVLSAHLLTQGWSVTELGRRPSGRIGSTHREFTLGKELPQGTLSGVDVLVHCAWDFGQREWQSIHDVNILGTEKLFDAAERDGVQRIIHISTTSAAGAPDSMYGRAKLATEKMALDRSGLVIRLGLVYGPEAGGVFGMLRNLVVTLPIIPVLVGEDNRLLLVHKDDFTMLIEQRLDEDKETVSRVETCAAPETYSLREILKTISEAERRRRLFLRVPWQVIYFPLRAAEMLRIPTPLRADSALSIATIDRDPFSSGGGRIDFRFRRFSTDQLV